MHRSRVNYEIEVGEESLFTLSTGDFLDSLTVLVQLSVVMASKTT